VRSVLWETTTAATLMQAGADIVVLRHPRSVAAVKRAIAGLMDQAVEAGTVTAVSAS
jgi:acetyl-CoA decarbonylase/synthase complex subunit delta